MPLAGFEPTIPASERPQAHASVRFYYLCISSSLQGRFKAKIRYNDCRFMRLPPHRPLRHIYSHGNISLDVRQVFRNAFLA